MSYGTTGPSLLSYGPLNGSAHSFSGDFPVAATDTAAEIYQQIDVVYNVLCKAGILTRPYTLSAVQTLFSLSEERQK